MLSIFGSALKPHVADLKTQYNTQMPVVNQSTYADKFNNFMNVDVVQIFDTISEMINTKIEERLNRLDEYFDSMWNNLGFDAFADRLMGQFNDSVNTVAPVLLNQVADLAKVERDFLEKMMDFIADSIITHYDAVCAEDAPFAYRSLSTYACSDTVSGYVKKVDEYLRKVPVHALDFAIDLLKETAECGDIVSCDLVVVAVGMYCFFNLAIWT